MALKWPPTEWPPIEEKGQVLADAAYKELLTCRRNFELKWRGTDRLARVCLMNRGIGSTLFLEGFRGAVFTSPDWFVDDPPRWYRCRIVNVKVTNTTVLWIVQVFP